MALLFLPVAEMLMFPPLNVKLPFTFEHNGQVFIEGGSIAFNVAADDVKGIKCDSMMTLEERIFVGGKGVLGVARQRQRTAARKFGMSLDEEAGFLDSRHTVDKR